MGLRIPFHLASKVFTSASRMGHLSLDRLFGLIKLFRLLKILFKSDLEGGKPYEII